MPGGVKKTRKGRKPTKKLEAKTASELVKIADKEYSRYIRLRDSRGDAYSRKGKCITCSKTLTVLDGGKFMKNAQNGHFMSRGFHITRYDDMNCNLQCSYDNAWRDKRDMTSAYAKALDKRYGAGVAQGLEELAKQDGGKKLLPKAELLDIIYTCRSYNKRILKG